MVELAVTPREVSGDEVLDGFSKPQNSGQPLCGNKVKYGNRDLLSPTMSI